MRPLAAILLCLLLSASAGAAPQIPAHLDLAAARIVVEGTPIAGQYLVVCQTDAGPQITGPWHLEAGDVASFPMMRLRVPCWVQAGETREGELMAVYETPRFTVWRAWLPEVVSR
jgi:hypothetical protein